MPARTLLIAIALLLISACTSNQTPASPQQPAQAGPTQGEVSQPEPSQAVEGAFAGLPLPAARGSHFTGSGLCTACHTAQRDQANQDVSIDSAWRASIIANAGRDPYWQATVRSEVIQEPELSAVIQEKCATCHMPMAVVTLAAHGEQAMILDDGLLAAEHPLQALAADGVSCNLCHQVDPDNFGQADSFSGGYLIDTSLPEGQRLSYGPYVVDAQQAQLMQSVSGFIPQQGLHMGQSELCGTCHDLYTPYVDENGQVVGEFAEQLIYSEWENSSFNSQKSCSDCHQPVAEGGVQLSTIPAPLREPFNQHIFVGGNAFMLNILQKNGEALQVTAAPEHFAAAIDRSSELIATQSAKLTVDAACIEDGRLRGGVIIQNMAGHKFPAGYPSRRAWLHIRILDAAGQVVFESGLAGADGVIAGNDNDADGAKFEPHYTELQTADQVQIYEAILLNSQDQVTTALLRAARLVKDNRLLPDGFSLDTEKVELLPQGEAAQDADFVAGSDTLLLNIDLGQAQGPYTLQVELLYQTIAYRWAENLRTQPGREIEAFDRYYLSVPNQPLPAASVETTVSP